MSDETSINLPQDVTESIAIENVKSVGQQPAMLSNLAFSNLVNNTNLSQQNAVANQQAMNEIGVAVVGRIVNYISNPTDGETKDKNSTGVEKSNADSKKAETRP